MEIGLIFKIAAVGILVTILSLVLSWIGPYFYDLFDTVQTLFSF